MEREDNGQVMRARIYKSNMKQHKTVCSLRAKPPHGLESHRPWQKKNTFQQPQVVELTDGYVDCEADRNCLITSSICILLMAIFAN